MMVVRRVMVLRVVMVVKVVMTTLIRVVRVVRLVMVVRVVMVFERIVRMVEREEMVLTSGSRKSSMPISTPCFRPLFICLAF